MNSTGSLFCMQVVQACIFQINNNVFLDSYFRLTDLGSASANRPAGALLKIKSSHTMGQQLPGTILLLAKAANQVNR